MDSPTRSEGSPPQSTWAKMRSRPSALAASRSLSVISPAEPIMIAPCRPVPTSHGAGLRRVGARVEMGGDGPLERAGMPGAFARNTVGVYERPQVAERAADIA